MTHPHLTDPEPGPVVTLETVLAHLRAMTPPAVCRQCGWIGDPPPVAACPDCGSRYLRLARPEEIR